MGPCPVMRRGLGDLGTTTHVGTTKAVMNRRFLLPLLAVMPFAAVACGGDDAIVVSDAWARTSPAMATMGAAYMNIEAPAGDTIVGVRVPTAIADHAEIHEVVPAEGEADSMDAAMVMQQVMSLELPAGETVELKPGGYHIMLIDLATELEIGSSFNVILDFEKADDLSVMVEVREG